MKKLLHATQILLLPLHLLAVAPPAFIEGMQFEYTPTDGYTSVPYQQFYGSDDLVAVGFSNSIIGRWHYTYSDGVISFPEWSEGIRLTFTSANSGTYEYFETYGEQVEIDDSGTFSVVTPSLEEKTDWQLTETFDSQLSGDYWQVLFDGVSSLAYDDGELSFIFGDSTPETSDDTEVVYARTLPMNEDWQVVVDDIYVVPGLNNFEMELDLEIGSPEFECELSFRDYGYGNGREFGLSLEQQLATGDWEYASAYVTANEDARISSGGNVRIVHVASSRDLIFEYQPDGASEWSKLASLNLTTGAFQGQYNSSGDNFTGGLISSTNHRMAVGIQAQAGDATQIADLEIAGIEIGSYTPPAVPVESNGNTSLLKNENGYFIGDESRPLLWEGAQLGELPGWTYLGVETGSDYTFDLLLTDGSTYYVFYVDNGGDIVDFAELSQVQLRVYETNWSEDLDGDSQIGNPPAVPVESNGNTSLLKNENGYFIGDESRPLLWEGAQLGELPGWTYLGVETGSDYTFDLLLTDGSTYYVFYVDNGGDIVDFAELSQVQLRVYETNWSEDLDGDSQIGNPPAVPVESNGNTSLLKNENGYFIGDESRPLLWEGAQLGELPGWTYLGVETGSDYTFDLLLTDGSTYYVFYVDNGGDIVDFAELSQVQLRVYETNWSEDLDGDSQIGNPPAVPVESNGNTSLLKNENGYFIGDESRPLLWEGAQLGELPGWTYLGVETGSDYTFDLLLTDGSTYYVFYVDNGGDIVDFAELSQVQLRVYETNWSEDLDGDSQIGNPPAVPVESNGNTSLLKNENGYFIGDESRPLLWEGAQLGELPGWTYLGVETGSDYTFDLLLTDGSTYYVFYVDNGGDIVDFAELSQVQLRVYETNWSEDLDGDSQIGNPPAVPVESNGNTSLLKNENGYFIGDESRPLLWEGAQLGELPGWTYLGVETGSDYTFDLLLTDGSTYYVFYVDNGGDIVDFAELSQVQLRVYETNWSEDLDGDGYMGPNPNEFAISSLEPGMIINGVGHKSFIGSNNDMVVFYDDSYDGIDVASISYVRTGANTGTLAESAGAEYYYEGTGTYPAMSHALTFTSPNSFTTPSNYGGVNSYTITSSEDLAPTSLAGKFAYSNGVGYSNLYGGYSSYSNVTFSTSSSGTYYGDLTLPINYTYQKVGPREGRMNATAYDPTYGSVNVSYVYLFQTVSSGYYVGVETFASGLVQTNWGTFYTY